MTLQISSTTQASSPQVLTKRCNSDALLTLIPSTQLWSCYIRLKRAAYRTHNTEPKISSTPTTHPPSMWAFISETSNVYIFFKICRHGKYMYFVCPALTKNKWSQKKLIVTFLSWKVSHTRPSCLHYGKWWIDLHLYSIAQVPQLLRALCNTCHHLRSPGAVTVHRNTLTVPSGAIWVSVSGPGVTQHADWGQGPKHWSSDRNAFWPRL